MGTILSDHVPTLELFAAIRARTIFGSTGYAYHDVQVYSFSLGYDATLISNVLHPPSTGFQIMIGIILVVVLLYFFPVFFQNGMSIYEIVYNIYNDMLLVIYLLLCIMCIAVIVVDVEILNSLKLIPMKSKEIRR